jgi:hypothetical protein
VAPGADVRDYLISEADRSALGVPRAPREQLLLVETPGELEVGLFVDQALLERLEAGVDEDHLADYLLAVEGVSHFLYVMVRARAERPFSALELELQAEVDKYLLALLAEWPVVESERLRARLYRRVRFHEDLSSEERDRYATANAAADEYAASLEARYVRRRAIDDMLDEMRRFYRLGCAEKLDHIRRKAA